MSYVSIPKESVAKRKSWCKYLECRKVIPEGGTVFYGVPAKSRYPRSDVAGPFCSRECHDKFEEEADRLGV